MRKKIFACIMLAVLLLGLALPTFAAYIPTDYTQVQIQSAPGGALYLDATLTIEGPSETLGRVVVSCENNLVGTPPPEITFYFYNYPSTTATIENNGKLVYNVKTQAQEGGAYNIYIASASNMQTGWVNESVYYVRFATSINTNSYNAVYGASTIEFTLNISTGTSVASRDIFTNSFVTINQPPEEPTLPETPPWGDETDPQTIYDLGYYTGYDAGDRAGYMAGYSVGYDVGYSDGRNQQQSDGVFSGIGSFLTTTIGGFMDFELLPNVSIGGILTCIVGLYGLFAVLRYFAGG